MPKKQVFADYFTSFHTREISGDAKVWRLYQGKRVAWSGDLYEHPGEGRKETSTPAYPLIGPYDTVDPAVLEYHILLAKNAGLDGFFCEYALPGGHDALAAERLARLGKRLNFKVGIHWVTHNFTRYAPGVRTRRDLVPRAARCLQTAFRRIYAQSGIFLRNRPVVLFFVVRGKPYAPSEIAGTAFSAPELRDLKRRLKPAAPLFLTWAFAENFNPALAGAVDGFYPWMIPSGSPVPAGSPFDTQSTLPQQLRRLRRFYQTARSRRVRNRFPEAWGGAWTGFDDRRGRAWGENLARFIPRENGQTFRKTWDLAAATGAGNILLATWNDWVESTQLEPGVERGYADLENAQAAIAAWKKTPAGPSRLRLPVRLFALRKKITRYRRAGFSPSALASASRRCSAIALRLSRGQETEARRALLGLEADLETRFEKKLLKKNVAWQWSRTRPGRDLKMTASQARDAWTIVLAPRTRAAAQERSADGRLGFSYADNDRGWIRIWQGCKAPGQEEKEIAFFRKKGTRKPAWVELDVQPAFFPPGGLGQARFRIESENPATPLQINQVRLQLTLVARK